MKRGIGRCVLAGLIGAAFLLAVWGCGGARPETPETADSTAVAEPVDVAAPEPGPATATDVEPTAAEGTPSEESGAEASEPPPELPAAEPPAPSEIEPVAEELLLSWERQGGPRNHCDRMSIHPDGRVVVVPCTGGVEGTPVEAILTPEQASQLDGWVDRLGSFSRRESDVTRAVMRTVLEGRGDVEASTDEKTAVARFAKELFLSLTSAGSP